MGNQIVASFLLLVLLVSTTGFSVFSHMCLMNGNVSKDVTEQVSSCCETSQTQKADDCHDNIVQATCCVNDITYIKFSFDALREDINTIELQAEHFELLSISMNSPVTENTFTKLFAINLPPPKPGRDILLQTDLLRI
ncbi:MAG: HYC_CC_PP family protein [Chitinophagales bacterium]